MSSTSLSLLDRAGRRSPAMLSENQLLVDGLIGTFVSETTKGSTLLAMLGAGFVSRFTRIGVMASPFVKGRAFLPAFTRGGSHVLALANESAAFAGIERRFAQAEGHPVQPFEKAWAQAAITLGSLKFFGGLTKGQNLFVGHLATDLGFVAAHHAGYAFGLTEKPEGSFASQMVKAEGTNWSLKGGMALMHGLSPNLSATEKSLDLYLKNRETDLFSQGRSSLPNGMALAAGGGHRVLPADLMKLEGPKKPKFLEMAKKDEDPVERAAEEAEDQVMDDAMSLHLSFTFLSRVRELKGALRPSAINLDIFSSIKPQFRLSYALGVAHILLENEFLPFQRMKAFPALVRSLDQKEQLDFALQLHDKFADLQRAPTDLEPHVEQFTSIFSDLHPENFLPFVLKISTKLADESSRNFAQACLRQIGSKQEKK